MTPRFTTLLLCVLAFVAGGVFRLCMALVGEAIGLLYLAVIIATFIWIFVKTGFSKTRYTSTVWRVQLTAIWSVIGFNLAVFIEGFA